MQIGILVDGLLKWVKSINASTGVADADKIITTDATGLIDTSLIPAIVGTTFRELEATVALSAGDFVNIYNDTGTAKCRKADASLAREANGFVLDAVLINGTATVYLDGVNTEVTGFTAGEQVFLSATTAGEATETAVAETVGYINQVLGTAVSSTAIAFEFNPPQEFV